MRPAVDADRPMVRYRYNISGRGRCDPMDHTEGHREALVLLM